MQTLLYVLARRFLPCFVYLLYVYTDVVQITSCLLFNRLFTRYVRQVFIDNIINRLLLFVINLFVFTITILNGLIEPLLVISGRQIFTTFFLHFIIHSFSLLFY
jgi:hypothetical protein